MIVVLPIGVCSIRIFCHKSMLRRSIYKSMGFTYPMYVKYSRTPIIQTPVCLLDHKGVQISEFVCMIFIYHSNM